MTIRRTDRPPLAVLAVLAVAATTALAGCATAANADDPPAAPRTITGRAVGSVDGVPDTLTVTLGVDSRAARAHDAMQANAARATAVIGALKAAGVAPKDLRTTQLAVSPTFDSRGRINGYQVSNVVTARLQGIDGAGAVIDAAAAQAGDDIRVQGIELSIADTGRLMAAARADAVHAARAQAAQMARAAGVKVGAVRRITETRTGGALPVPLAYAGTDAAAKTPVEAGSQELTVAVTVVFEIADR